MLHTYTHDATSTTLIPVRVVLRGRLDYGRPAQPHALRSDRVSDVPIKIGQAGIAGAVFKSAVFTRLSAQYPAVMLSGSVSASRRSVAVRGADAGEDRGGGGSPSVNGRSQAGATHGCSSAI